MVAPYDAGISAKIIEASASEAIGSIDVNSVGGEGSL